MAFKLKVVLSGVEYPINLSNCGGCEYVTLGACGWYCDYDPLPDACAWPGDVIAKNPVSQDGPAADEDDQLRMF